MSARKGVSAVSMMLGSHGDMEINMHVATYLFLWFVVSLCAAPAIGAWIRRLR